MTGAARDLAFRWLRQARGRFVSGRRAEVLADVLVPLVTGSRRILDVGCGNGGLATLLDRRLGAAWVAGADVLPRRGTPIPIVSYDGERLPFASASFDVTLLVDVLHHAADPLATLREAARVSRGAVVVKDHIRRGPWSGAVLGLMDWLSNRPYGTPLTYRYLSIDGWRRVFAAVDLEVERFQEGIDLYPRPFNVVFRPDWQFVACLRAAPRTGPAAC